MLCRVSQAVWNDFMTTFAVPGLSNPIRTPVIVPFHCANRNIGIMVLVSMTVVSSFPPPPPIGMNECRLPSPEAGVK
jgi:hypothetical protein